MAGAAQRRRSALAAAAGIVGAALREVPRTLPGAVGAAAICYGLGLVYTPLAFIAAGVFLIILDWRIP